ncbi:MAG: ATP-binding protein [Bacteroidales bacterium]
MKTNDRSKIELRYRIANLSTLKQDKIEKIFKELYTTIVHEQEDPELAELDICYIIDIYASSNSRKPYMLTTNCHYSLSGSYAIKAIIEDWLRANPELNQLYSEFSFEMEVCFKKLQIEDKSQTTGNTKVSDENNDLFQPQKGRYDFNQLILNNQTKDDILDGLNLIKHAELIFNDWGFSEIEPSPRSIMNFYGPPGTGKTMCAEAIADHLNRPILRLNYAEIESKYVGEAAKNMMAAFSCATRHNAIMFFDEADSFLGKRIQNVTHGSEQALNSLRSQTLILLEDFKGIVLFATNLVTNYDKAFESRILKHIRFDLPEEEARIQILLSKIPSKLPMNQELNQEQLIELAILSDGFSGREIKNTISEMLSRKAREEGDKAIFRFEDFKRAFEMKKKAIETLHKEHNFNKNKIIQAMERKTTEAV